MKKKSSLVTVAAAALLALTVMTSASAAIRFNPETGVGFVGKGQVQLAFGWNNAELQANAENVRFEAWDIGWLRQVCVVNDPAFGMPPYYARIGQRGVEGSLDGGGRTMRGQRQFTGFNLTGWNADAERWGPTWIWPPAGFGPFPHFQNESPCIEGDHTDGNAGLIYVDRALVATFGATSVVLWSQSGVPYELSQ
jgi:hypothetical protein